MPGLTCTEIFGARVGRSFDDLPPSMVMDVNDMVDAALSGFDQGELITIPSLFDRGDLDTATIGRASCARLQPLA